MMICMIMLWMNREKIEKKIYYTIFHISYSHSAQQKTLHVVRVIIIIVIHTLPIVFIPPIVLFLALAAFILRIFASMELRLGAFEATNLPDPA